VRIDLLDMHHNRRDRRFSNGSELGEQLRARRDADAAIDAQRGRAAGGEEEQSDASGLQHVVHGVEPLVAGRIRDAKDHAKGQATFWARTGARPASAA
jgi:hypothetical protein